MFGVQRKGRLGNQMFICAFAIWASEMLGASFHLDRGALNDVFTLDGVLAANPFAFKALRKLGVIRRDPVEDSSDLSYRDKVADWCDYHGYFASPLWFEGAEASVRRAFQFRRPAVIPEGDYVCVNVRRGDFRTWRDGTAMLGPDWYRRALAELAIDAPVWFVSDEDVTDEFADVPDAQFRTPGDMNADMQTVAGARWVIVSASTFSWWGAWLSRAETVIAPRHWMGRNGSEWPPQIIPAGWAQLPR